MKNVNSNKSLSEGIYRSSSRLLLNHAEMEYSELSDTWRDIERKAQGTIAIAGIFSAGIVAILKDAYPASFLLCLFLTLSFSCLVISTIEAILALFVSEVVCIEDSENLIYEAKSIFDSRSEEEAKETIRIFVMNRLEHWKVAIESLSAANRKKVRSLEIAQKFMFASVIFFAFAFLGKFVYV